MGYIAKENTTLAIEQEVTEGTYVAPVSGASFLSVLSDGLELTGLKELKERNILNASIGVSTPRPGQKSSTGTIPVEYKSGSLAGDKPEFDSLLMSLLGSVRQNTTQVTTKAGNSASILQIEDADISKFAIGDIVLVLEAGAYHVSPVITVDATGGAANITLLVAATGAFSDAVVIEKHTTYYPANSGQATLSISKYLEGSILQSAAGCRTSAMSLNNFTTGALSDLSFTLEGIDFIEAVTAPSFSPDLATSLPPLILEACVYQDGVSVQLNEFSLSVENTIGWITSTCSSNGRIASRVTRRVVSGTMNPYKSDSDVDNYTGFDLNTPFSLFFRAYNPTGVAGEFNQVIAGYMPNCIRTEMTTGDKDSILTDALVFSADRGSDGSNEEIYLGFI